MASPELTAKPLAILMPTRRERALLSTLTPRQQAYAVHWLRSNWKKRHNIASLVKKAKANHP